MNNDIWFNILCHIDIYDIKNIIFVNKLFNQFTNDSFYWLTFYNTNQMFLPRISPLYLYDWIKEIT